MDSVSPAQQLVGKTLENGWTVREEAKRIPQSTGGRFSFGYVVDNEDGRTGFLKAIDYTAALQQADPSSALNAMTEAFNYERKLCELCTTARMKKVIHAIDHGKISVDGGNPAGVVQYLIFEFAEKGDIRQFLHHAAHFDHAWALRTLHHVATGITELHSRGIAHQDLKPSNVLIDATSIAKIGDLGRASKKGDPAPHDSCPIAGQLDYAPPEFLYGFESSDWDERRRGCDLFHLGSLGCFLYTSCNASGLLLSKLDPSIRWHSFGGTFDDALPHLRHAFSKMLEDVGSAVPERFRERFVVTLSYLCEPDPRLRGHPLERRGVQDRFSLRRFVSQFHLLASNEEFAMSSTKGK